MSSAIANAGIAWVRDLTFIAAIAMPEPWADEFGTTVNGMWANPDRWTPELVAEAHARGRRILVSVPLIALTHQVYERPEEAFLVDEVCRDLEGGRSEVEWYYWDAKPVYALCVHSPVVRAYLVDRLRGAIEAGVDVVNVDEINTSVGLMTRKPKGSGFCHRCLSGSSVVAAAAAQRSIVSPDDTEVRSWLREDRALYAAFESEQQARAFHEADELLSSIRSLARDAGQSVAITANTAGMGAFVGNHGPLWSAMWGELSDVIMLEAIYVVSQSQFEDPHAHKLLPRGTFAPLYRLGRAIGPRAPIWIAPQINVPRQLAGQRRHRYYEMMFLEAYANLGRWGYNWWPGVDEAARREATAPEALKAWTAFMRDHPGYYAGLTTSNDVAVIYSNAAVLAAPNSHYQYLALAQALYEGGVQFDVVYTGDDRFAAAELDPVELSRYRRVLVPAIDNLSSSQAAALDAVRASGGAVVGFESNSEASALLDRFWSAYGDADRDAILAASSLDERDRIVSAANRVVATRYVTPDGRVLIHLLDYDYREAEDFVEPARDFILRIPWTESADVRAVLVSASREEAVRAHVVGTWLEVTVPELQDHAVLDLTSLPGQDGSATASYTRRLATRTSRPVPGNGQ